MQGQGKCVKDTAASQAAGGGGAGGGAGSFLLQDFCEDAVAIMLVFAL